MSDFTVLFSRTSLVLERDGGEMWGQLLSTPHPWEPCACQGEHLPRTGMSPTSQHGSIRWPHATHGRPYIQSWHMLMASSGLMVGVLSNNVKNYVNHTPIVYRRICTILWSRGKRVGVTERPGLRHKCQQCGSRQSLNIWVWVHSSSRWGKHQQAQMSVVRGCRRSEGTPKGFYM